MADADPLVPPEDAARAGSSGRGIDAILDRIASATAWIWLLLMGVIGTAVVLRYVFGVSRIELEELQWHLYAIGFLAGIVGCVVRDRHVRVDVLRERMSERLRDWIDFYGLLLFQLPLILLVLWSAGPFVVESFVTGEASSSAGGLPHRWLLKGALPVAFLGLGLATLSRLRAVARRLFGAPPAAARSDA